MIYLFILVSLVSFIIGFVIALWNADKFIMFFVSKQGLIKHLEEKDEKSTH